MNKTFSTKNEKGEIVNKNGLTKKEVNLLKKLGRNPDDYCVINDVL